MGAACALKRLFFLPLFAQMLHMGAVRRPGGRQAMLFNCLGNGLHLLLGQNFLREGIDVSVQIRLGADVVWKI